MGKYIDAEKLKYEIERRRLQNRYIDTDGYEQELFEIIDSLQQEQPEVDLEKEMEQWRHEHFKEKRDGHYSGEYLERKSQLDIARHFYELGLKARKEE